MIKGKLCSRLQKLEDKLQPRQYAAVVIIDEGEKLPDNIGPDTVILIDNISAEGSQADKKTH